MNPAGFDPRRLENIFGPAWPFINQLYDSLPLGATICDSGGFVAYINAAQQEIDGLKPQEVVGTFLCDAYKESHSYSVILNCLGVQKPVINTWQTYSTPKRKDIHAVVHAFPIFLNGSLSGCVALTKAYPKAAKARSLTEYLDTQAQPIAGDRPTCFEKLVGQSPVFRQAINLARASAANYLPVLLYGETGVGKELFARSIHQASPRSRKPFVAVNCAAIPDNLFEGLMFGVSKGAFTGALEQPGFFEQANGGSIYLDELDSMPPHLQGKLLRVLQEGEVRRLGSRHEIRLDVKIIGSMAKDPLKLVEQGAFRSDLFYRLGVLVVAIPPLRERMDDLEPLLLHFIAKHSQSLDKHIKKASPDFIEILRQSRWSGNVRELEHIVSGAISLANPRRQTLGPDLLPEYFKNLIFHFQEPLEKTETKPEKTASFRPTPPASREPGSAQTAAACGREALQRERQLIVASLERAFGNVALAARLMDISPQRLHYRLKKHGLEPKKFRGPTGRG